MPEGLLSAINPVLPTKEARIARLSATYPKALRAAINSTVRRYGGNWHMTRAGLLRAINEVGRFDISGSVITVGPKMQDAPPKVFLTVIQKDDSFKTIDRL
jgi:hypothetical protein